MKNKKTLRECEEEGEEGEEREREEGKEIERMREIFTNDALRNTK